NPYAVGRARAALDRAAEAAPGDDRVWLGFVNLPTRTARFDEADRWLRRCGQSRPAADPPVDRARLGLARAAAAPDPPPPAGLRPLPRLGAGTWRLVGRAVGRPRRRAPRPVRPAGAPARPPSGSGAERRAGPQGGRPRGGRPAPRPQGRARPRQGRVPDPSL